ncbi:MAG: hypothetical protein J7K22_01105 [Nanoarchaeota archaeon]|nr:hypothetical protein [Nanoarchaeota archaeon]
MSLALLLIEGVYKKFMSWRYEKKIIDLSNKIAKDLDSLETLVESTRKEIYLNKDEDWTKYWNSLSDIRMDVLTLKSNVDNLIIGETYDERKEQKELLEAVHERISLVKKTANADYIRKSRKLFGDYLLTEFSRELQKVKKSIELNDVYILKEEKEREDESHYLLKVYSKLERFPPDYVPYPKGEILTGKLKVTYNKKEKKVIGKHKDFKIVCEYKNKEPTMDEITKKSKKKEITCYVVQKASDELKEFVNGYFGSYPVFIYELSSNTLIYNEKDTAAGYYKVYFTDDRFKSIYDVIKENAKNDVVSKRFLTHDLNLSKKSLRHLEKTMLFPLGEGYLIKKEV